MFVKKRTGRVGGGKTSRAEKGRSLLSASLGAYNKEIL